MNIYLLRAWTYIFNFLKIRSFGYTARMAFYDKIYRLCSNEVNLGFNDVVGELKEQQFRLHNGKSFLYFVYSDIHARLAAGADESESLSGYAPNVDIMMINSFKDDDISVGFQNLINYNKTVKEMNSALAKALIYPCSLFAISIAVIWYFSVSLIPALTAAITPGMELSQSSEIMIALSENFYTYILTLGIVIGSLVSLLIWALPNYNGKYRVYLEKIPPFSIYRIVNGCGFLNALAALSNSGYQQLDALQEMKQNTTNYLGYRLELISERIKTSETLGSALVNIKLDFPDKKMLEDIELVSKFGVLDDSLESMAENMTQQGTSLINKQAATLKYIATAMISMTILLMFNGIYSLSSDMGNAADSSQQAK